MLSQLPEVLHALVAVYLDPLSLNRLSEVSRFFRDLITSTQASSGGIWERIYVTYASQFSKNVSYSTTICSRIMSLSLAEIRHELYSEGVFFNSDNLDESYYFFLAWRLFGRKSQSSTLNPPILPRLRSAVRTQPIHYPTWTLNLNPWKASYFYLKKDVKRVNILKSEFFRSKWEFKFRYYGLYENDLVVFYEDDMILPDRCRFNPDFTMNNEFYQPLWNLQWRILERDAINPRLYKEANHSTKYFNVIQVDAYPVLTFNRLANGGWRLENDSVIFTQIWELGDYMPLL